MVLLVGTRSGMVAILIALHGGYWRTSDAGSTCIYMSSCSSHQIRLNKDLIRITYPVIIFGAFGQQVRAECE